MFDLSGKVAVVTGASRGLGRQDALTLAQAGADVVITDILVEDDPDLQKSADELGSALAQVATAQGWVRTNQTAEEVQRMGRRSRAIKMDVTNREQVREVFKKVKDEFGRIDILVNNAATLDNVGQIQNMSYELWDRDVKVNLTGAFNCTKEVWPYMIEQKWGRVIFMSSVAGTMGGFGQASYSATKMAAIALARTAALGPRSCSPGERSAVPGRRRARALARQRGAGDRAVRAARRTRVGDRHASRSALLVSPRLPARDVLGG